MPRKKVTPAKKETPKKICAGECKKEKHLINDFYSTTSDLYPDGKYPICKACLTKNFPPSDPNSVNYVEAVKNLLAVLNKPFLILVWESSIEEAKDRNKDLFGMYMKNLYLNHRSLTFKDSEFTPKSNFDEEVKTEMVTSLTPIISSSPRSSFDDKDVQLTEEDVKTQQDCIRLLGYDPFAGYSTFDRKFLYAELIPYLDEDTLEDQYKISILIQLLNNNNQIRKIDLLINKLSSDEKSLLTNSSEIKSLTSIKNTIATNNDKLSKENAIAIKHRGDKKAGRSTLGFLMKDLRELGFDKAEEDYYDMKKAYGMQMTADISHKSILSQLNFDEKDIEDMFKEQREMIANLQSQKHDLEEKVRLANEKITEMKQQIDKLKK